MIENRMRLRYKYDCDCSLGVIMHVRKKFELWLDRIEIRI